MPRHSLDAFQRIVASKFKNDHASLTERRISAAGELCEEAGEVFGRVKKHCYYYTGMSQDEHLKKIISELGDALGCLMNVANSYDVSADSIIDAAIEKFDREWPSGFTPQRAGERYMATMGTDSGIAEQPNAGDLQSPPVKIIKYTAGGKCARCGQPPAAPVHWDNVHGHEYQE